MLLWVDIGLRIFSFKSVQDLLQGMRKKHQDLPLEGPEPSMAKSIERSGWIVRAAGRYHIHPMSCLRRALVLQWLLEKQGISTDLRFGARSVDGQLQAHAWLERNGELVSEPEIVYERFAVLRGVGG